jgi:DNA-directed RNA polymerase specialized sigma24 family protein
MQDLASVSQLIVGVKANDEEAAQRLYERYLKRLAVLARAKMHGTPRRVADEEDVAHTALAGFFAQVRKGSFPRLANREDLWQILIMLTDRRVADLKRRQSRQKRDAGRERGESELRPSSQNDEGRVMEQIVAREPAPEQIVELIDLCQWLFDQLEDPLLKRIASFTLQGYDQSQIAQQLGCVRRTVQRKLLLIREIWRRELLGFTQGKSA